MKCPLDETTLVISERQGIEIDYCPQCRGVWLDRGELDKLIERADSGPSPRSRDMDYKAEDDNRYRDRGYRDDRDHDKRHPKGKKKESFLSDLFEFGD